MDGFIKMHLYLQRGKLNKSFNSSNGKFHIANFTSMRKKKKFFKLQKMVTNDEK